MEYNKYLSDTNPIVVFEIEGYGNLEVQLFPDVAPNTVRNMVYLVENNAFDNSSFHRIIAGFMIQGGQSKQKVHQIRGEFKSNGFDNPLKHTRGVISMARTSNPNSATSQFFIMHKDAPHLDGQYAAFGALVKGYEILDEIAGLRTDSSDKPYQDVVIKKVSVDKKKMTFDEPVTVD